MGTHPFYFFSRLRDGANRKRTRGRLLNEFLNEERRYVSSRRIPKSRYSSGHTTDDQYALKLELQTGYPDCLGGK